MTWQPIDTAPKDGIHILAWSAEDDRIAVVSWAPWDNPAWEDYGGLEMNPTHWMPLPQLPNGGAP